MKYLTNLNLDQNQLQNAVIGNEIDAPQTPKEGQIYYDTVDHRIFWFNGTTWVAADAADAVASLNGDDLVDLINGSSAIIDIDNLDSTVISESELTTILAGYSLTSHNHTVDSLSNVTIASKAPGQVLYWSGSAWVNHTLVASDISDFDTEVANNTDVAANTAARHEHTNKSILDATTASFTTDDESKLDGIEAGAEVNVQSDWAEIDTDSDAYILNKPTTLEGFGLDEEVGGLIGDLEFALDARLDDLEAVSHSQNTDLGTSNNTFYIGTDGPKVKNSAGIIEIRNAADDDYADLKAKDVTIEGDLVVKGTTTTIESNTVAIGDSEIELNSDITLASQNSDGGIAIKRLASDNSTRADAKLTYNESDDRWTQTYGPTTALVTSVVPVKLSAVIEGDAETASFVVTHDLATRDVYVSIRENFGAYEMVMADVLFALNSVTINFASAPADGEDYSVTIIG